MEVTVVTDERLSLKIQKRVAKLKVGEKFSLGLYKYYLYFI